MDLFQCAPTTNQTGSGILTVNGKADRWRLTLERLILPDDTFPYNFYKFLTTPIKNWKDSPLLSAFLVLTFEIARRVKSERYVLTRDQVIEGISLSMDKWNCDEIFRKAIREDFVGMFDSRTKYDSNMHYWPDILKERRDAYDRIKNALSSAVPGTSQDVDVLSQLTRSLNLNNT